MKLSRPARIKIAAERAGKRVTLDYRQDRKLWWRCNPSENFITAVEK